jgi:hypothetical protein
MVVVFTKTSIMKQNSTLSKSSISFKDIILELGILVVIEAIIGIAHHEEGIETGSAILAGILALVVALGILFLKKYLVLRKGIIKYANQIEYLEELQEVDNLKLRTFILENLVSDILLSYKNFVSGSELNCPYHVQIQIADRISTDANQYFWATSLDTPSKLWNSGGRYFGTLGKLSLSNTESIIPTKARIVLLDYESLINDYSSNQDAFHNFVNWHKNNSWGLRFYQNNDENINEIFKRYIEPPIIKDYLVKDDQCVYGRLDETDNGATVTIKLLLDKPKKIEEYKNFFEDIWRQSEDADRVVNKINLKLSQKPKIDRILNEQPDFKGKESGKDFFNLVCFRIEDAKKTIHAVDIADLKNESKVKVWKTSYEYLGFLKSCIIASNNNVEVIRIFILEDLTCLTNDEVKEVMLDQLRANLFLGFVAENERQEKVLCREDYIIVDDNFGFKLVQNDFKMEELAIENNIIWKSEIQAYKNKFNQIKLYTEAKQNLFKGAADIDKFNAFTNNLNIQL